MDYNTKKHVLITGNPIFDENGEIKYVVNNVRDITDLENLIKELKEQRKIIYEQELEIENLRKSSKALEELEEYGIVAKSEKMRNALEIAQQVGTFDTTVLILGESGSGKEVIAKSILYSGNRKKKPYLKVNCGAIPENLLESELFGYDKGAFTGANNKGKVGIFEMANHGTIFLDEIADLPLNLQVKLLRVLQEKEIMRIGGNKVIPLDVRIIAATNKDIEKMVKEGKFREDLYYRLNIVTIKAPPLRKRVDDIPLLTNLFLKKFNQKYDLNKIISPKVIDVFMEYSWPGNVRELENVVESMAVLTNDKELKVKHIPEKIKNYNLMKNYNMNLDKIIPLKDAVDMIEEKLISQAMDEYKTTRKAASVLGVDQSTIVRKLQKFSSSKKI